MNPRLVLPALLAVAAGLFAAACNTQSGTDTQREIGVDFTGVYSGTARKLVSQNSGDEILTLNLSQKGSRLEAFDNNGIIFRGNVGRVIDGEASFTLKGVTTAGQPGQINGTLSGEGTSGRMGGTWIENDLFGVVSGQATIANVQTNAAGGGGGAGRLGISPSGNQTLTSGQTQTFSASGGSQYQWSMSNSSIGRLNTTTGRQVTYTAFGNGSQTLTVRSGQDSATVTITQSGGTNINQGFGGVNQGFGIGGRGANVNQGVIGFSEGESDDQEPESESD